MTTSDTARPGELGDTTPDAIVPDYSRVPFRGLQALCKERQIPADGNGPQLIEKLKLWDAQHDRTVDTTLPEGALTDDDEDDLLGDDTPTRDPVSPVPLVPDSPAHAQSTPAQVTPTAHDLAATPPPRDVSDTPEAPTGGGEVASAPPPGGLPLATDIRGRDVMSVRNGLVRIGEGHQGREVRAYRREFFIDGHEITDDDHFRFIAETHVAAATAGHATKGGANIGQRVGYAVTDGRRTVVYQVPLRREA